MTYFFIICSFFFFFASSITSKTQNILQKGSSLHVEDGTDFLISPDKTFTCGFYGSGLNAYWFSVWFTNSKDKTVVWMANRDRPVNQRGSKITLQKDGAMVLKDVDGSIVWETNTTSTAVNSAELLNTGNLVLKSGGGKILWQSFDFPTDTLLPNQPFTKSKKLVSSRGPGDHFSGFFSFLFNNDNVLRLMYDGPDISSLYWPNPDYDVFQNGRTNYNSTRIAVLDDVGRFLSSDQTQFNSSDMGSGIIRRLTIDYDGNLRLYSLNNSNGLWNISWVAMTEQCKVHGQCGRNGICVYTPEPKCSCPPGYEMTDQTNWISGCKRKFNQNCSVSQTLKFVELHHTDYYGFDLYYNKSNSFEQCKEACLKDCLCEAFSYRLGGEGLCFTKSALFNGFSTPNFQATIYLKLPSNFETPQLATLIGSNPICSSKDEILNSTSPVYQSNNKRGRWVYLYSFVAVIGFVEAIFIITGCFFLFGKTDASALMEDGYRAISSNFRRFCYRELKKATGNFKIEVGRGGCGTVYKGILTDERVVAVKRLNGIAQGDEEFWAEVSTIGTINHMNLVRMWGFCSEANHKLLVYEYVENKSLDGHIFSSKFIGWIERFKVALGVAKGLAYLHNECLEWVIHCDIKPENILLDSEFEPKITDFGLAKLSKRGGLGSEFSRIRGTKGYMAPEWTRNIPITAKVDVYSYGIVILEMVRGSRVSNWVLEDSCEDYQPELARFVTMVKNKLHYQRDSWLATIVDPRLKGEFSKNQAIVLIEIGLACVDEDKNKRPTMDFVVQRLLECENQTFCPEL